MRRKTQVACPELLTKIDVKLIKIVAKTIVRLDEIEAAMASQVILLSRDA